MLNFSGTTERGLNKQATKRKVFHSFKRPLEFKIFIYVFECNFEAITMAEALKATSPNKFCVTSAALLISLATSALAQQEQTLIREDRQKTVITSYEPRGGRCHGVVIISHGAGGSEKGYSYLGEGLQALGYLAVIVGHKETGMPAIRKELRKNGLQAALGDLITDPSAYRARFMDITVATNWGKQQCSGEKVVLLGHSMGAATAMLEAGAANVLGLTGGDSFDAYVVLSPQGQGAIFAPNAWSTIKKPVLSITGTRDKELGGGSWDVRTEPYFSMPPGCKWLGVIKGASHMNFAGRGVSRKTESLTVNTISAFLQELPGPECKAPTSTDDINIQSK